MTCVRTPGVILLIAGMLVAAVLGGQSRAETDQPKPGDVVLLDFGASWCGPCRSMVPVVGQLAHKGWMVRHVDVDQEVDLVRRFAITGVPCYVLLVKGEEKGRVSGVTTLAELEQLMAKSRPAAADPAFAQAAASAEHALKAAPGIAVPITSSPSPLTVEPVGRGMPTNENPPAAKIVDTSRSKLVGDSPTRAASANSTRPAQNGNKNENQNGNLEARLLAATARLRVEDAKGVAWGTGTVIDCRQGESLILTCGHIFRDSAGKGRVEVDLFGSDKARGLAGQVIAWDLKRDLALVSVFTDEPIVAVRVGTPDRRTTTGEDVVTVGCDGGADPTVHYSRVTGIDKYLGPANVQVAGQPVQGRSGGGLFAVDGTLIGVCNAADPADNEGLFAALSAIHDQLEESGLGFVYRSAYPSGGVSNEPPVAAAVPNMPAEMPVVSFDRRDRDAAVPTASVAGPKEAPAAPPAATTESRPTPAGELSQGEQALLDHVRRHGGNAEVICIVRPHDTPHAASEVFVLQPTAKADR